MSPTKAKAVQTIVDIEPLMGVEESGSEEKECFFNLQSRITISHIKEKRVQIPVSVWKTEASRPVTALRAVQVYFPRCSIAISLM